MTLHAIDETYPVNWAIIYCFYMRQGQKGRGNNSLTERMDGKVEKRGGSEW